MIVSHYVCYNILHYMERKNEETLEHAVNRTDIWTEERENKRCIVFECEDTNRCPKK